jgi:hypothetical protein
LAHHVDRGIDGHGRERRTGPRCDIDRGIEVDALERRKRPLCRTCVDWSERKHHLGGAIGAAVLAGALVKNWAVRGPRSRAVTFSALGEKKFVAWYSSE